MKKQPEVTAATRKNLIDAFWTLYKEKTIDKITIAEITRLSGNNRVTFYHYFKDVYAVLEHIEDNLIKDVCSEVRAALNDHVFQADAREINYLYTVSMPIFKRHAEKIFTLLGKNGDPRFTNEFRRTMRTMLIQFWNLPQELEHLDYMIEFSYSAMIGLMTKWYENGNDLTDGEFFKLAQGLVANGVLGYLNQEVHDEKNS